MASYDFAGTEEGDLSFNADDIINVISTDGEWWKGSLGGATGIFPANYVKLQKVEEVCKFPNSNRLSGT